MTAGTRPKRRRTQAQIARAWATRLRRTRPGLPEYVIAGLTRQYGAPDWRPSLDPVSQLVLTILTQNTADVNAERAFEALRAQYPGSTVAPIEHHLDRGTGDGAARRPDGWGGEGLPPGRSPDWAAIESADPEELIEVIRGGGLAYQKAPRIQRALRTIREAQGRYDLGFLAALPPLEARDWLTQIPGIGRKTASIVLLFCFGLPLFPIDTHVERVTGRIGLLPADASLELAHEMALAVFEPAQMFPAHVLLITHGRQICHARNPACDICPIAERCRYFRPKAP